jgi:hypothetical protein
MLLATVRAWPGYSCGQPRAGHELHRVEVLLVAAQLAVVQRFRALGGDVLPQRAAEHHVQQLEAAADAEHRLAGGDEGVDELDLVLVAHRGRRPIRAAAGCSP